MKQPSLFEVIYEDAHLIAVNKASGIAVGGDRWDAAKERLDGLLPVALELPRVFTVHRIDRDTSGIVLFAKDEETHRRLSLAFEERRVEKRYIAIVHGRTLWTDTTCDLPLVPDGDKQHRTIIDHYKGKKSRTVFHVLGCVGNYSVIEALPETGRTHQIRVHLASLGHPVVCDALYSHSVKPVMLSSFKRGWRGDPLEERPLLARLGLHALSLSIPDEALVFCAPFPRDLSALFAQMNRLMDLSMLLEPIRICS